MKRISARLLPAIVLSCSLSSSCSDLIDDLDIDASAGTDTDADSDTGTGGDADTDSDADTDADADTDTDTDADLDTDTDSDADSGSAADAGSECAPNSMCCDELGSWEPGTTVCRPAVGVCDIPERCDGAGHCPADAFAGSDTVCREGSDAGCDVAERCSGGFADCPPDAPSCGFGFFVMSDGQLTSSGSAALTSALSQMEGIDSAPIATFFVGDLTADATATAWSAFVTAFDGSMFNLSDSDATFSGPPRFFGAVGNHDNGSVGGDTTNWYTNWSANLTGQAALGSSSQADGIYYSVTYGDTLFVVLDTELASSVSAQSTALYNALSTSSTEFKFVFFHEPVYPCGGGKTPFAAGLPWIDLAEQYDVDAVFVGHTHVYSRSCRMIGARCTGDGSGTIQVEVGSVSGDTRSVDHLTDTAVTGTDDSSASRTDTYNCTADAAEDTDTSIMNKTQGGGNTFCHVAINGLVATVSCYVAGNTAAIDIWSIDHR
jgi:hypothetical protein